MQRPQMEHRPLPLQRHKSQQYEMLKKVSLARRELFVDPEFPPHNKSLFYSHVDESIMWRRPKELSYKPALLVNGLSALDLHQGDLGNGWFVSACAWLTQHNVLFHQVHYFSIIRNSHRHV